MIYPLPQYLNQIALFRRDGFDCVNDQLTAPIVAEERGF